MRKVAESKNVPFHTYRITTKEEAQSSPIIWSTFGLLYNGKFITHEILSVNKFEKLLAKLLSEQKGLHSCEVLLLFRWIIENAYPRSV
ncbi:MULTISPECIES: YoaP domain-containing protein [Brevibacillus]|uniref:YoaP domain-containing protein n=1 Tax=Brevibacillus TaxID=55080 RepID=UPI001FE95BA2|nr:MULTISPECIES: YoaP domain-containing protein [Brevibacillus]MCM3081736.1 YoaP domain-containing protein [Brevibacillus invocatus]MCM3432144.1 YoaP domain-containing protein [Brevibacillus invocatus]